MYYLYSFIDFKDMVNFLLINIDIYDLSKKFKSHVNQK